MVLSHTHVHSQSGKTNSHHTGSIRLKVPCMRAEYQKPDWCVRFLSCPVWFFLFFFFSMHSKHLLISLPSFLYVGCLSAAVCTGHHCSWALNLEMLNNTWSFQKAVVEALQLGFWHASWYLLNSVWGLTGCFWHHVVPNECPRSECLIRQILKVTHRVSQPPNVRI